MKKLKKKQVKILFIVLYLIFAGTLSMLTVKYVFKIEFSKPEKIYYEPDNSEQK